MFPWHFLCLSCALSVCVCVCLQYCLCGTGVATYFLLLDFHGWHMCWSLLHQSAAVYQAWLCIRPPPFCCLELVVTFSSPGFCPWFFCLIYGAERAVPTKTRQQVKPGLFSLFRNYNGSVSTSTLFYGFTDCCPENFFFLRSPNRLHPSLSGRGTSRPSGVMHLQIRILNYVQWASLYDCRHNRHHLFVASPPGKYFSRGCMRWALQLRSTVRAKSLKFIPSPPFWLFSVKGVRAPYHLVAQQTMWACPYVCIFVSPQKKGPSNFIALCSEDESVNVSCAPSFLTTPWLVLYSRQQHHLIALPLPAGGLF